MERLKTTDAVFALILIVSLWMLHEGHALELGLKQLSPIIDMLASSDEENLTFEELLSKRLNDSSIPEEYKDDAARLLKVLKDHGYNVDVFTLPNVEASYNTAFNSVRIEFQRVETRHNVFFPFEVQVYAARYTDGKISLSLVLYVDQDKVETMKPDDLAIAAALLTGEAQRLANAAQAEVDNGRAGDVSTMMLEDGVAREVKYDLFLTSFIMWQTGELKDSMITPAMRVVFEKMLQQGLLTVSNPGARDSSGLLVSEFVFSRRAEHVAAQEFFLTLLQTGDGQPE